MVDLVKSRIEFSFDHAIIAGQRVNCPPEIPHKQWLEFWEYAMTAGSEETIDELKDRISDLEQEIENNEEYISELESQKNGLEEKLKEIENV